MAEKEVTTPGELHERRKRLSGVSGAISGERAVCVRRAILLAEMADAHLQEYKGCEIDRSDMQFVYQQIRAQLEMALYRRLPEVSHG